jgi:hypothetical protein
LDKPWFDDSGALLFDEYVMKADSYQKITEDSVISGEELVGQAERVTGLLKQLESMLSPEAKSVATSVLVELSVLNLLHAKSMS